MQVEFSSTINSQPLLAVLVSKDTLSSVIAQDIFTPFMAEWIKDASFSVKEGETLVLPKNAVQDVGAITSVLLVSVAEEGERTAAGKIGYFAKSKGYAGVTILHAQDAYTVISQAIVGNYRWEAYQSKTKPSLENLVIVGAENTAAKEKALTVSSARNFARDLVNAPADDIYPETLANKALELASEHIQVEVWGEEKMEEEGMVGILAVGRGSINPSRFIHVHYTPPNANASRKKLVLVGKGVTFDSGGLSLKPSNSMQTMRCDMAGSAVVLGVFHALAKLLPDVEVHGLIGAVENMNSGNSYKLGDILRYKNGKTVEIHNTDAEGRLVLADCLIYGSAIKPDYMIDFATLTGACIVALGNHYAGVMTNEADLLTMIQTSSAACGERVWQLPLPKIYKSLLKATWSDLKNVGGPTAGSITAGLFLSEFVENTKWAHVDIAGPAFLEANFEHFAQGGTGTMVESTLDLIASL